MLEIVLTEDELEQENSDSLPAMYITVTEEGVSVNYEQVDREGFNNTSVELDGNLGARKHNAEYDREEEWVLSYTPSL